MWRVGAGDMPEGAFADPRHDDMGWRSYGESSGDDGTEPAAAGRAIRDHRCPADFNLLWVACLQGHPLPIPGDLRGLLADCLATRLLAGHTEGGKCPGRHGGILDEPDHRYCIVDGAGELAFLP